MIDRIYLDLWRQKSVSGDSMAAHITSTYFAAIDSVTSNDYLPDAVHEGRMSLAVVDGSIVTTKIQYQTRSTYVSVIKHAVTTEATKTPDGAK